MFYLSVLWYIVYVSNCCYTELSAWLWPLGGVTTIIYAWLTGQWALSSPCVHCGCPDTQKKFRLGCTTPTILVYRLTCNWLLRCTAGGGLFRSFYYSRHQYSSRFMLFIYFRPIFHTRMQRNLLAGGPPGNGKERRKKEGRREGGWTP